MTSKHVFVTGPSLENPTGGIAFAMPGYLESLEQCDLTYELLITREPDRMFGRWLPWFGTLLKIPLLVMRKRKSTTLVYAHAGEWFSMLREGCILGMAKMFGAKTVMHLHAAEMDRYLSNSRGRWFFNLATCQADLLFVLTPWWKERFEDAGIRRKIYVIPNPLTKVFIEKAGEEHPYRSHSESHVLCMTRLVVGKGVRRLIQAVPLLPDNIHITIAGDGDQRHSMEKLAAELGVANQVSFTGWVSGKEKNALLRKADIFCLLSTRDSFSLALIEAMSYGLPVITMKSPCAETLAPMADMVKDDAPELIAEHIYLLAKDQERRRRIGKEAQQWLLSQYTPTRVSPKIDLAFNALLEQS